MEVHRLRHACHRTENTEMNQLRATILFISYLPRGRKRERGGEEEEREREREREGVERRGRGSGNNALEECNKRLLQAQLGREGKKRKKREHKMELHATLDSLMEFLRDY